jgi:hypothetical protein
MILYKLDSMSLMPNDKLIEHEPIWENIFHRASPILAVVPCIAKYPEMYLSIHITKQYRQCFEE